MAVRFRPFANSPAGQERHFAARIYKVHPAFWAPIVRVGEGGTRVGGADFSPQDHVRFATQRPNYCFPVVIHNIERRSAFSSTGSLRPTTPTR
jgi:hypothetical protein